MTRFRRLAVEGLFGSEGCRTWEFPRSVRYEPFDAVEVEAFGIPIPLAVRLLFHGVTTPELRVARFPATILSEHEFLFGHAGLRDGLPAEVEGDPHGRYGRIHALMDLDGDEVEIERRWIAVEAGFEEQVRFVRGPEVLDGREANLRLAAMLPPHIAPLLMLESSDAIDLFDVPSKRRSAFDAVSFGMELRALICATEEYVGRCHPHVHATAVGRSENSDAFDALERQLHETSVAKRHLGELKKRVHREREAGEQELERLKDAFAPHAFDGEHDVVALAQAYWRKRGYKWRDWISPSVHGRLDAPELVSSLSENLPGAKSGHGREWLAFRLLSIRADLQRLQQEQDAHWREEAYWSDREHDLAKLKAFLEKKGPSSDPALGNPPLSQRVADCLVDVAAVIGERRREEIARRVRDILPTGLHTPDIGSIVVGPDFDLHGTDSDGAPFGRANVPPLLRKRFGLALMAALAAAAPIRFPIVLQSDRDKLDRKNRAFGPKSTPAGLKRQTIIVA